VKTVVSIDINL